MQPLAGVTILDLTRLLPGPFGSWLLRSWGARVIKVEDLGAGDYLREMHPLWFDHLNRGAESIAIDLKRPAGRELFLRLLPQVDLVLEGFRPGVMERLGLSHAAMAQQNPALVLVSLSGYPSDGPQAGRAGHDLNYMAQSGLLALMDGMPGFQLGDMAGGLMAAAGALAALHGARATGKGCHVQLSMLESLKALGTPQALEALAGLEVPKGEMYLGGRLPAYQLYETADGGQVSVAALEPKFWAQFCAAVERRDWIERQADPSLKEELAALFRSRPLVEWERLSAEYPESCLEPVLRMSRSVADVAQLQPVLFERERPLCQGHAPELGEQTERLLTELGISRQEIIALAAEGCIRRVPRG